MGRVDPTLETVLVSTESVARSDASDATLSFLQVRIHLGEELKSGKYPHVVMIAWDIWGGANLPSEEEGVLMTRFLEAIQPPLEKNKLALLAYIYTGEGRREYCFYTRNVNAFLATLNDSVEEFPTLPLSIEHFEDLECSLFEDAYQAYLKQSDEEVW